MPKASDFRFTEETLGAPDDGELLVRVVYVSLDPAMRGWMNERKSYVPPASDARARDRGGHCVD